MIAAIAIGIITGLLVNEFCELSPWSARKLARWSAFRRYADPTRAETRAEELAAVINDRPGNLFKLITAFCFAAGAAASQLPSARAITGRLTRGESTYLSSVIGRIMIGSGIVMLAPALVASRAFFMADHGLTIAAITLLVGEACVSLSWAIGGVMLALNKLSSLPLGLGCLLLCLENLADYLFYANNSHLIAAAIWFSCSLAAKAVYEAVRKLDRPRRRLHDVLWPDCIDCFGATTD